MVIEQTAMTNEKRLGWQRWLFAGLVIAFLWVLAQRFAEIQQLLGTLVQGDWPWVITAIVLEIIYYVIFAALFKTAFDLIEIPTRLRDLIPIAFAFLFANTTTASGGTAGLALFVDDIRRRGGSAARATAGTLLAHTANYGMFAVLLTLGLFFLFLQNDLTGLEVVSALILFLLVLVLCSVLVLGLRWPHVLQALLHWIQGAVNQAGRWVKRPFILSDTWAEKNASDFIAAAQAIAVHPARLGKLLGLALCTHLIHVLVLFSLFYAFHQAATPGILLAGYTMSILFMIVSPTPNGIGVVEAVVPIMYNSLGVPTDTGIIITFAFRGITFWIPMVIGFILLRQLGMFGGAGHSLAESGQVRLLAVLTTLMGVLNVLAAIQPALLAPIAVLTNLSPVAIQGSRITAVVSGFLLLALAQGLWRHKRAAWWLVLIVLVPSILSHAMQRDMAAAGLGLLLVASLVSQRAHFVARSDPPSVWQGLQVLAAALAFTLAYGIVGFYLLDKYYGTSFSLQRAWQQTLLLFTTLIEPTLNPNTAFDYFADSIYIVGLSTLVYALIMLLRPVLVKSPATERERRRAEGIVTQYGRSALSALIPLPDRAYYFSPGGSVVACTHHRRIVIALGDPVGPEADRAAAIQGFRDYCRQHDWEPAFYRTLPVNLEVYTGAGLQTLCIGQEAVVDLSTMVRPQVVSDYHVQVYQPPYAVALLEQLRLVSDAWLATTGKRERPFTADRFGRAYLDRATLAVVYDKAGTAIAVASVIAAPDDRELLLGMLRYGHQIPDAAIIFMLGSLADWAHSQGYSSFNLGFSPLVSDTIRYRHPRWEQLLRLVHLRFSHHDQLEDLHTLKDALQPKWEPRYLVFSSPASLPAVSAALVDMTNLYPT